MNLLINRYILREAGPISLIKLANKNGLRHGNLITFRTMLDYDEISQLASVQKPVLLQVIRDLQEKRILSFQDNAMTLHLGNLAD
ncbi:MULTISPECIES: hypothetical protein [unclassified Paenibacillus]|uniref:hypothetical protein n=1 Tax=unclassified Paenibacillus TaxID=185978 RepID=UPI00115FBF25|nr:MULTISPECIES: hypothetical protein [unclassified Paenibacillus]